MRKRFLAVAFCALATQAAAEDAADKAKIEDGATTYENYCATCHGMELRNNTGVAFDLRRLHADEHPRFVNSVLHGKQAMPAWDGTLTTDQVEELWAYVRANANDAKK
ncbi:MAG: cytochrome c like protein [Rhodospirillales bacterium]|nr:cytochrome c like protein [Rhodospirillales bacterium]